MLFALQDLQAQLCSEQEAVAKKEAELQAVHGQMDELEAQLATAQNSAAAQPRSSQGSEPPLMLPAPSDPQVCLAPVHNIHLQHFGSVLRLLIHQTTTCTMSLNVSLQNLSASGMLRVVMMSTAWACSQGSGLAMSASEAAELRAAAAEKAALLGAAEERLARLEALHRIAQVPSMSLGLCMPQNSADWLGSKGFELLHFVEDQGPAPHCTQLRAAQERKKGPTLPQRAFKGLVCLGQQAEYDVVPFSCHLSIG